MPRPPFCRRISGLPVCRFYKPQGIPASMLEQVILTEDEWEAVRLADKEGLYHEQAAERMNVSRQTFGRILESARRKIADALVSGKALLIQGGCVEFTAPTFPPAGPSAPPRAVQGPDESVHPEPHRPCGRRGRHWHQP
ncbi:MAG TPA: DUF134 domain-containing protein [Anaerohalosphaeraceae bacterium]|nr:DUF134 domain-containing protein [Anaerohalosphaeraceae bacterium]